MEKDQQHLEGSGAVEQIEEVDDDLFLIQKDDTPRKKKLKIVARKLKYSDAQKTKVIKRLRQRDRRNKQKIKSLTQVLGDLEDKHLLNDREVLALNDNIKVTDLINRQIANSKNMPLKKYSPDLRAFALTLHFYSPKAYEYVRQTFDTCLPHPRTISRWYQGCNAEPGFTSEAFAALKMRSQATEHKLLGSLIMDEMAIRQLKYWKRGKYEGIVDMGTGISDEDVAKEALVFLVNCINGSWKLPVAYFFVNGLSGLQRANLVVQCLEKLHETGVEIVSLTFDGCPANLTMVKKLGCSIEENVLKTVFAHPSTKKDVAIFLDPCHMLKLLRNSLESTKRFIDAQGNYVDWQYFVELNRLQEKETLHLGNKITKNHINFHNHKMKVKYASQLLSSSVAKAMLFCQNNLKLPEFQNATGTINFINTVNDLFDSLNSRNVKQRGFKSPLNCINYGFTLNFLNKAKNYLLTLKNSVGPMVKTRQKTGFIGFCVCIESTKSLYKNFVEKEKKISFLPTYKVSQDHIELFFGNMRGRLGFNNNPTTEQFKAAYKKMLTHMELRESFTGNCIPLENISILTSSSPIARINNTSFNFRTIEFSDTNIQEKDLEFLKVIFSTEISEFSKSVVKYIASFVARSLLKVLKCEDCCDSLYSKQMGELDLIQDLISLKNNGGLTYPSQDVVRVCETTEKILKTYLIKNEGKLKSHQKNLWIYFVLKAFLGVDIFANLRVHQFDMAPINNHVVDLIKAVAEKYIDVRLYYISKIINCKPSKRQVFNKITLFKGQ